MGKEQRSNVFRMVLQKNECTVGVKDGLQVMHLGISLGKLSQKSWQQVIKG